MPTNLGADDKSRPNQSDTSVETVAAVTTVEISIIGLCLCFLKRDPQTSPRDRIWNIIFPCDERHELYFYFPQPITPGAPSSPHPLHIRGVDLFLDFISDDPNPQPATEDGTFGRLLNMADPDIHGVTESGKHCKLKVHRKPPSRTTDQVWLRVPRATLSAVRANEAKECWVEEVDANGTPIGHPISKGPRSEEVKLSFRFEGRLRVAACIGNDCRTFDHTFEGGHLEFKLDNKCQLGEPPNDFLDYYECVLDGPNHPGKRFNSGKVEFALAEIQLMDEDKRSATFDEITRIIENPQANCDPVGSEPPPGP